MFFLNPFSPGKRLTSPALFSGRHDDLRDVTQRVIQAAGDNAMHTLITGERGIGKSSFSSQLQGILRGEEQFIDLLGPGAVMPYKFLVVEHVSQSGQGSGDVAVGLLRELKSDNRLLKIVKNIDLTLDIGPLTAKAKEKGGDTTDIISEFVIQLSKIAKHHKSSVDGVVLVVDEVDRIADAQGVSTFFKVATERLSTAGLNNVAFVLVGMLGTLEKLKKEHQSAGRVFLPHPIPLLEQSETIQLMQRALVGTSVTITQEAAEDVHAFSGGYPNAVHLIGEVAFAAAASGDGEIDQATIREAVDRVVVRAAPEDYDPLYLKFRGRSRQILRFMASQTTMDVASRDIVSHLRVKPTDVSANFDTLLKADVLVRPEDGHYRIRDPLFREYLRDIAQRGVEPLQRRPKKRDDSNTGSALQQSDDPGDSES